MIQFKDARTGRVQDMPEGHEVRQEWDKAAKNADSRAEADAFENMGVKLARHADRTITRMGASKRWERYTAPAPEAPDAPALKGTDDDATEADALDAKPATKKATASRRGSSNS